MAQHNRGTHMHPQQHPAYDYGSAQQRAQQQWGGNADSSHSRQSNQPPQGQHGPAHAPYAQSYYGNTPQHGGYGYYPGNYPGSDQGHYQGQPGEHHFNAESHFGYNPENHRHAQQAAGHGRHHDPLYDQWRNQQIQQLDEDYDAWHQERYQRFADDFDQWRRNRQERASTQAQQQDATPRNESNAAGEHEPARGRSKTH